MSTSSLEVTPLRMVSEVPASKHVQITAKGGLTPDGFVAQYITFPLNLPESYGNSLYLWDSEGGTVPWSRPPQASQPIASDSPRGDQPFKTSIQKRGYIIGYSAAKDANSVCSTLFIPADDHTDPSKWRFDFVSLSVNYVGIDTLVAQYNGLAGYDPAKNKNWIGLWRGNEVRYEGDPMKAETIITPESDGTILLTGLDLRVGATYSLGYFMAPLGENGRGRTSLAATVSFSVA